MGRDVKRNLGLFPQFSGVGMEMASLLLEGISYERNGWRTPAPAVPIWISFQDSRAPNSQPGCPSACSVEVHGSFFVYGG
jgi:hypothetical protein